MVAKPDRQLRNREARTRGLAGGGVPLRAVIDTNLLVGALESDKEEIPTEY